MGQHNDAVPARRRERAFVIVDPSDRLETSLSCVHIHDYDVHAPSQAILLQRCVSFSTRILLSQPEFGSLHPYSNVLRVQNSHPGCTFILQAFHRDNPGDYR